MPERRPQQRPYSDALVAFLFLVVRPGAPSCILVTTSKALVTRSDALVPSTKAL